MAFQPARQIEFLDVEYFFLGQMTINDHFGGCLVFAHFQVFQNKPGGYLMVLVWGIQFPPETRTLEPGALLRQGGSTPECEETED